APRWSQARPAVAYHAPGFSTVRRRWARARAIWMRPGFATGTPPSWRACSPGRIRTPDPAAARGLPALGGFLPANRPRLGMRWRRLLPRPSCHPMRAFLKLALIGVILIGLLVPVFMPKG